MNIIDYYQLAHFMDVIEMNFLVVVLVSCHMYCDLWQLFWVGKDWFILILMPQNLQW